MLNSIKLNDKVKSDLFISLLLVALMAIVLALLWYLGLYLVSCNIIDLETLNNVAPGFIVAFSIPILRTLRKKKRS